MAIPTLVAPSSRTWLGIAREAATGTPVLPVATIPLDKSSYEPEDTPKFLEDLAIRGSMSHRFADVLGPEDATFSYGGPFFGDVWGYFLDNIFGDLSTTGTTPTNPASITSPTAVGATSAFLTSISGYSAASVVQVDAGSIAEVVILSGAPSGSTITFAGNPLRFAHAASATVATVTGPYTHVFAVLNQSASIGGTNGAQPPTHTATDYTSLTSTVGADAYPSLCIGSLDFSGNAEQLLMAKATGNSWLSSPASTTPTNSTAFTVPLPVWQNTLSIGGTQVTSIGEWAVSLKREMAVYWTAQNAQTPYIIARGDLDASGSAKFTVPSDTSPRTLMTGNSQPSFAITSVNGLSGTAQIALILSATNADFIKSKITRSGVLVGFDNEFRTHANTTDVGGSGGLGQFKATLINNTPTY